MAPPRRSLRIPRATPRTPGPRDGPEVTRAEGELEVRTHRVVVRVAPDGESPASLERLARRLSRELDRQIAAVPDASVEEFDDTYRFAIVLGGFRVEEEPLGGGFTSPFVAAVTPRASLAVTLRTVETDGGGPLDRALADWAATIVRGELPALKRLDAAEATSVIAPGDWVFVPPGR